MLKSKIFLFFSAIFFLVGCENQDLMENTSVDEVDDATTEENDDRFMINDSERNFPIYDLTELKFPLIIDSDFITNHEIDLDSSTLTGDEVKKLSKKLINYRGDTEISYVIKDFIKIDSLKANNAYNDYLATIDIAMTKNTNANSIGFITLNNGGYIDIWSISFTTLEACPFYEGTVIYATYYNDFPEYNGNTILVGEISGGGDAPYWVDVATTSKITSTRVDINLAQKNGGEYDENDKEIVDSTFENHSYAITENGFSLLKINQ